MEEYAENKNWIMTELMAKHDLFDLIAIPK
jgi:hypothetical protein